MRRIGCLLSMFACVLLTLLPALAWGPTPLVGAVAAAPALCAGERWTDLAPIPVVKGRALGVNAGNAIYVFGGRPNETDYSDQIYRYNTAANSWSLLPQTLPDRTTSNMAGGLLSFPEGERIFIVGGSGSSENPDLSFTRRAFAFNPADGAVTPKATWPVSPRFPGGWAVAQNKLYIFGGGFARFQAGSEAVYDDIWVYDPLTDAWTQLPARLSVARGYIATETMPDGLIYLAGGSLLEPKSASSSGGPTDLAVFERFDPGTNAIVAGPSLPKATSNNHGYSVGGKFVVPAGGARPPTTAVQIYDPATNAWSGGPSALQPLRSYAKGYGRDGAILVIGGYGGYNDQGFNGTYYNVVQGLTCSSSPSPAPSPAPSPTATTAVPAPSPTATTAVASPSATSPPPPASTSTPPPASTVTPQPVPTRAPTPTAPAAMPGLPNTGAGGGPGGGLALGGALLVVLLSMGGLARTIAAKRRA